MLDKLNRLQKLGYLPRGKEQWHTLRVIRRVNQFAHDLPPSNASAPGSTPPYERGGLAPPRARHP